MNVKGLESKPLPLVSVPLKQSFVSNLPRLQNPARPFRDVLYPASSSSLQPDQATVYVVMSSTSPSQKHRITKPAKKSAKSPQKRRLGALRETGEIEARPAIINRQRATSVSPIREQRDALAFSTPVERTPVPAAVTTNAPELVLELGAKVTKRASYTGPNVPNGRTKA